MEHEMSDRVAMPNMLDYGEWLQMLRPSAN